MNHRHIWKVREKRWPQIWNIIQKRGGNHGDLLNFLAKHYGWTVGQAYMATEFMFRPENYN